MMRRRWERLRTAGGYGLFAAAVGYALYTAPYNVWHLRPAWLLVTVLMLLLMILMQILQVMVFLKAHGIAVEVRWAAIFSIKRGLLNAILPARGGTLIMMRSLTARYPVRWQDYLLFNLVAAAISMLWSLAALVWLLFDVAGFVLLILVTPVAIYFLGHLKNIPYRQNFLVMIWIAGGLYATILLVFWTLLNGMGLNVGFRDAMYFAVALNALAQISITPGNLGVREWVMAALAPYLALPVSLGILAGGAFHVLRVIVYGLVLMMMAGLGMKFPESRTSR